MSFSAELEIDPANGNARYELAQMAVDDNHLDEAGKLFGEVVERFPEFEEALVGLGEVYLETNSTAAAIATLERATRLDANDEVAWYRLSRAERQAVTRTLPTRPLKLTARYIHQHRLYPILPG